MIKCWGILFKVDASEVVRAGQSWFRFRIGPSTIQVGHQRARLQRHEVVHRKCSARKPQSGRLQRQKRNPKLCGPFLEGLWRILERRRHRKAAENSYLLLSSWKKLICGNPRFQPLSVHLWSISSEPELPLSQWSGIDLNLQERYALLFCGLFRFISVKKIWQKHEELDSMSEVFLVPALQKSLHCCY